MTFVNIEINQDQAADVGKFEAENLSKGVSLHWLQNGFLSELKTRGKDEKSTIRDIEDLTKESGIFRAKGEQVTCAIGGSYGVSYIDCLFGEDNVGPTSIVVVHSFEWGNTVGDILDTIAEYCEREKLDPKRFYVWMDFLCTNLQRLVETKDTKNWNQQKQFEAAVGKIKAICDKSEELKVLALMSPWHSPVLLNHVWSIYEMYHYVNYADRDVVKFAMPPEERNNMIRSAVFNEDGLNQLLTMVNEIDVAKIGEVQGHDSSETEAILGLIRIGPGIEEVNNWIKDWSLDCLVGEICGVQTIVTEEDIDRLCSQVAPIMMQNGSYNQAYHLFKKSLGIREKKGDKEAAHIASMFQNIGIVLQKMDEFDESMTYLKRALMVLKEKHGLYHIDTAECYKSIGDVHFALEDFEKALETYQMCQSLEEKVCGINHSRTATAYHNVGKVLNAAGRADESLVYFQQALTIREDIHGNNNVDVAATYIGIGGAFTDKNDHDEALKYYISALAIYEAIYGDKDAETAACCNSIAMAYCDRHDYEMSLPFFERTIKIYEETLGKSHPYTEVARDSYEEVRKLHEI